MPFDLAFWVEEGTIGGVLVVLLMLLAGLRVLAKSFGSIPQLFTQFLRSMLWEESVEEAEDGTKVVVRKPSSQLVDGIKAIAPVVIPVLLREGTEWAKKNVKLGGGSGPLAGLGGEGLEGMAGALISQLPKRYQGLAAMALPFLSKFLGGGSPTGGGPGAQTPNPYAGRGYSTNR